ncbi:MAG TPA: glycosyltransferase, partial [Acidimicrobiales bacterium]|nr:glycosyltransferase [Acidimicrobiales bacterium]
VDEFTDGVVAGIREAGDVDAIHANYWLSGVAGHAAKHELDLPLVSTFHTLARVKVEVDEAESAERVAAESDVIRCSDAILANCEEEAADLRSHYDAPAERIEIVPPGVDHAFFSPGDRSGARAALGWTDGWIGSDGGDGAASHPVLLFVGRIQPLKGLDVGIRALAQLERDDAELVVVGGPSGSAGPDEYERVQALISDLGVRDRVTFVEPQPHHLLSTWYRAADVLLVPSRSESFGLVALEAAACGTPVVASDVGGLRTVVADEQTGFLVEPRDPRAFAGAVDALLADPALAASMGSAAAARAQRFTWPTAAARLRRIYSDVTSRALVECR